MLKLGIVIGTRPEAIKLAPVALAAASHGAIDVQVIATGQHADMCRGIFQLFGIEPRHHLGIMKPGQSLTDIAVGVLGGLEPLLRDWRPDWLVVQGDTSSAFAAGLAAFYAGVRVAHVEAGLRSGDIHAPWPEEMNRLLLSRVASLHFAPTEANADTLRREQVAAADILVTGNTGVDALHRTRDMLAENEALRQRAHGALAEAGVSPGDRPLVLVTAHRRESFGGGLDAIMASVARLARRFQGHDFVFPVHPNPIVRETARRHFGGGGGNIFLTPPLDYLPFVALMARADVLLTDSGGIQEEAPSLGKRVIVMREVTERREGLATPLVRLAGVDARLIEHHTTEALTGAWPADQAPSLVYGDGRSAARIIAAIAARGPASCG
jgi:UDP-N-acetylglucosamine 2-epimerase (non-hydrolysing)